MSNAAYRAAQSASIAIIALLLGTSARATPKSPACSGSDIVHLTRPYYPNHPKHGTFDYSFRIVRAADPGAPTIIYLPGGPGDTSMDNGVYADTPSSIPKGFGLILTDPRSVGCNAVDSPFPRKAISSESLASDIVEIVRSQGLTRYYLHGVSYGTLLASVVAGMIERENLPKPEAVVLEGVVGRAFTPGEVFQGAVDQWNALKTRLPSEVVAVVNQPSPPLGLTAREWGSAIPTLLIFGTIPAEGDFAVKLLGLLNPSTPLAAQNGLKQFIQQLDSAVEVLDPSKQELYQAITCREIASEVTSSAQDIDFELSSGDLIPVPGHLCDGIRLNHPFDAGRWPTTAPIYYFEGSRDPSTPMNQALYSLAAETKARRTFTKVIEGSHVALNNNLSDCTPAIWTEIALGGANLRTVLKSCALQTELISVP